MNDLFTKTDYSLYSNAMTFVRRPYVRDPIDVEADVVVLGSAIGYGHLWSPRRTHGA